MGALFRALGVPSGSGPPGAGGQEEERHRVHANRGAEVNPAYVDYHHMPVELVRALNSLYNDTVNRLHQNFGDDFLADSHLELP